MDIWFEALLSVDPLKASAVGAMSQVKESAQYARSVKLTWTHEMPSHPYDGFDNNEVAKVMVNRSLTCDS